MDKKIKDTDYLFLSTRVRALETQMLTRDRMEQMLEAKVPEDAASVLLDCGYGDIRPLTITGINEALSAEQEKIYSELSFFAPDPVLIDVFKVRYDYHNAKVLLKSEAQGLEADSLLLDLGRVPARELREKLLGRGQSFEIHLVQDFGIFGVDINIGCRANLFEVGQKILGVEEFFPAVQHLGEVRLFLALDVLVFRFIPDLVEGHDKDEVRAVGTTEELEIGDLGEWTEGEHL